MYIRVALILVLTALSSCATRPRSAPKEIFDEQSGGTLSVVASPMVFARNRSDVAAHARDYATFVAIEVDHSGNYVDYLILYRWSTVDRRMSPPPDADAGAARLVADGRPIDLVPLERVPVSLEPPRTFHVPNHGDVVARAYRVEPAVLNFIATSREITLRMPQEPLNMPFLLWDDGRGALEQFLRRVSAP
jgi:hypothetical protein